MPSYPPRSEPVKKASQLAQKKMELKTGIQKHFPAEKLNKAAEKYRTAQLSFLKASTHSVKEKLLQNKKDNRKLEKLESEIAARTAKSIDQTLTNLEKKFKSINL